MRVADHYKSQRQVLLNGINAFEPVVTKLHAAYKREEFHDWPTIILATTVQTSAISLFKLLPFEKCREPLDKRSIASIVRNIVDTHDALDLLISPATSDQFNLHRNILGLYLAKRIATIQSKIDVTRARKVYPRAAAHYWRSIRSSPLYMPAMDRLKSGESIFYATRAQRVTKDAGRTQSSCWEFWRTYPLMSIPSRPACGSAVLTNFTQTVIATERWSRFGCV